jgi:hypothetical protein
MKWLTRADGGIGSLRSMTIICCRLTAELGLMLKRSWTAKVGS